jgi:heat induced stress protein YflT
MAGKNTAAFGIYPNNAAAEAAVDQLVAAGFSNQDVSVLMADRQGSKDFATEKNTKVPEGATTGAGVGGAVGGTLGLLAGIGALAIPGVGPLIAAGPIMGALAGLGVGGTVGGLVGALVGLGIPEYEAKRYEGRVKDGGILLSVHCDSSNEVSRAKDILKATGADDISSSGEKSVSTHGVDTDKNRQDADWNEVDRARAREVETERIGVSSASPRRTIVDRDREIG